MRLQVKEFYLRAAQNDQHTRSSNPELYRFWVNYHDSDVAGHRSMEDLYKLNARTNVLLRTLNSAPPLIRQKFSKSDGRIKMSQGELAHFLDDLLAFRVHSALVKIVPLHVRIQLRKRGRTIKRLQWRGSFADWQFHRWHGGHIGPSREHRDSWRHEAI